ncbi:MAG: nodulation protein NfeD [Rhodothermia bacterium]|nr:MAG: nodulation protein NfeD [Rhodothermia bacterium]
MDIANRIVLSLVTLTFLAAMQDVDVDQDAPQDSSEEIVQVSSAPVYVVPIDGPIDKGLAMYIDRAVADAESAGAAVLLFHIDTFGGLVDAADMIRTTILSTEIPTVAFIDHNAASAGALISYAADTIFMSPGSSIGAATVVEGAGGKAAPDKYQSYMRGLMRATAEANGRDPKIAEAMVDENLEVPGVSPAGQVLTLSTSEAVSLGVADAEIANLDAVITYLDLDDTPRVEYTTTILERTLRFFGSPVIQSILMLMMLGGLYFELQTPGVGFPGIMAALGAALFFGPNFLLGLVESWEILLFIIGVGLLLVEIFILPGFGVAGIAGLVLIVASLAVALIGNVVFSFPPIEMISSAIWTLAITLILLVVLGFSLAKYAPRSSRFNLLVLSPELSSEKGFTAAESRTNLVGMTGRAINALRPAGSAEIDDERIDVTTSGEYIEAGKEIRVVSVRGSRVEVREVKPPS